MSVQRRLYEEVWNQVCASAIDAFAEADVIGDGRTGPDGQKVGGAEAFRAMFCAALPELPIQIVIRKHTGIGLGREPRGHPVRFSGIAMARERDGKIVGTWNNSTLPQRSNR